MKKSKLTLTVMASLITTLSLAGCTTEAVTKGDKGTILTLTTSSGSKVNVTADDLFGTSYNETSGVKSMFDSVYELCIRNYWKDPALSEQYKDIKRTADNKVQTDKDTAQANANSNKTKYEDELDSILDSKGVESLSELFSKYEYELMKDKFEEDFNKDNVAGLRDGMTFGTTVKGGYLEEKIPYHVKHILVNVDAAKSALYDGEISEANAKKLSNIVSIIAKKTGTQQSAYTFGQLALEQSDDENTRDVFGDLGIMDKDTSYINEFKLGLYAFDSIYNKKTIANKDRIGIPAEQEGFFTNNEDAKIGQIPYGVFEELMKVADVTKDADGFPVHESKAFFYPRNIYFNKYLNNHRISVIVPNDLPTADQLYQPDTDGKIKPASTEAYVGAANATYAAYPGFRAKKDELNINFINNADGKVLCDEQGRVILVVRGGSDNYQGVHFIVVERSALEDEVKRIVNGVETDETISLANYYTPYYPAQNGGKDYPHYEDGTDMDTYVNKFNTNKKGDKERAEEVKSKILGYESNLNTYLYEKLAYDQNLQFHGDEGAKIKTAIETYIKSVRDYAEYNDEQDWEKTWNTYMEYIMNQTAQRSKDKLLSATCAIGYQTHSGAAWEKGGMCGYEK